MAPTPTRYDSARELPGLPAPVQRFFRTVLTEGQPLIAAASVEHRGSFNLSETGAQWKPFASRQRVVTRRPGFVWDGTVAAAPGVAVHVHDAYVAGEGLLRPAVLGLFTLADLRGSSPEDGGRMARWPSRSPSPSRATARWPVCAPNRVAARSVAKSC